MTDKPLLNLRKLKPFPVELRVLRLAHKSMADTSSDNFILGELARGKKTNKSDASTECAITSFFIFKINFWVMGASC